VDGGEGIRCPICQRALEADRAKRGEKAKKSSREGASGSEVDGSPPKRSGGGYFPFCSERCRAVDLGRWASEEYRVVTPLRPRPEETEEP
jgi:endogenous inhibitor of DNA gyrase (YacG/DUF329 family)